MAQSTGMIRRFAALSLLAGLAGCASSPAALGITGPGKTQSVAEPPPIFEQPETGADTWQPNGDRYAPSMVPTTNGGRYWGYN